MKLFIRGIYIASFLAGGAVSLWTAKQFSTHFFAAQTFQFQFAGSFSEQQKIRIRDFFIHGESFLKKPLSDLAQLAKDQFSSIDSLSIFQKPSGTLVVRAGSAKPVLLVNENLVLTDNRSLFERSVFDSTVLSALNQVDFLHIEGKKENQFFEIESSELMGMIPTSLFETGKNIPSFLFDQFYISCQNDVRWWLQDKQQKKFFILFSGGTIPNAHTLVACSKIKGTLESRNRFARRSAWVADVRFGDQIIAFRKPGGR